MLYTVYFFFFFFGGESKCYGKNILPKKNPAKNLCRTYVEMCATCESLKSVFGLEFYGIDEEWVVHMFNFCCSYNCLSFALALLYSIRNLKFKIHFCM